MRRQTVAIACAFAIFSLAACDSSSKQTQPTPAPSITQTATGNLCERMVPELTGSWKVAPAPPVASVPLADSCRLINSKAPRHLVRVSLSILPVSTAEAVQLRQRTEKNLHDSLSGITPEDAGLGEGSWFVDPAGGPPQIGFRALDRLVRLSGDQDSISQTRSDPWVLAELRELAKVIQNLPGGMPLSPVFEDAPHCQPGRAAAEKVLGTTSVVRRSGTVEGVIYCQWGSATESVQVESGGSDTDPAARFEDYARWQPGPRPLKPVKIGDQGWQEFDGTLAFRVGKTYADVAATTKDNSPALLELGRAMVPTYRR